MRAKLRNRNQNKRIWIHSLRNIKKGEEITYNYGFEIYEDDPYSSKNIHANAAQKTGPGYILSEDEWPRMRELLKKSKKRRHA